MISTLTGVYAEALGERWHTLAEPVRRLHTSGGEVHAVGTFRVQHGEHWPARLLAWVARMPDQGDAVAMRLRVRLSERGEEWRREFAGRRLLSVWYKHATGLPAEHMGFFEMRFHLEAVDGALHYRSERVAFRFGPLRVPLPGWAAPRVTASETARDDGLHVTVDVRLPILGRVIAYDGVLTTIEVKP